MVKGVAALSAGQAISQGLTLIGYIYLARLYEVEEFGQLALIMAVGSVTGGVSTFQYELSILLPKEGAKAKLATHSVVLVVFFVHCIYCLLGLLLVGSGLTSFLEAISVLAVSLISAMFSVASSVLNRAERYFFLASITVGRTLITLIIAVLLSRVAVESNGLVLAHTIVSAALSLLLMALCVDLNSVRFLKSNTRRVFFWLKLNKQFALYTTPAAFFNYLAGSAPVFLLAASFGEREVGLFSMLQRVVMGPVGIISGAVNRVFQRELTKRIYNGEKVFRFFESLSFRLVGLGFLGGFVLLGLTNFNGMSLVFGDKWGGLDAILELFVPVCIAAFFSSSLAGFAVIGSNRLGMLFQFLRLLSVGIGFIIGFRIFDDFSLAIMFMSWALTAMFVIQWLGMISILRLRDK